MKITQGIVELGYRQKRADDYLFTIFVLGMFVGFLIGIFVMGQIAGDHREPQPIPREDSNYRYERLQF